MSIFRRRRDTKSSATRRTEFSIVGDSVEVKSEGSGSRDDSDVFVCKREKKKVDATVQSVTLFVFGWHVVEPGTLSWAFPSLRAALGAVRTMKNAAQWCIVSGAEWSSMEAARAEGAVLIEQLV
jgi:hypothetical protein